jgi:hypothetical protein
MSVEVAAVVVSELRVVLLENLGAEIDHFFFAAFAVVVAAILPFRSARGRHIRRVVLLVAGPFRRAAEILLRRFGIRDTFDFRKRIFASRVLVDFHGVDPHFGSWVIPLIPWIGAVQEIALNVSKIFKIFFSKKFNVTLFH